MSNPDNDKAVSHFGQDIGGWVQFLHTATEDWGGAYINRYSAEKLWASIIHMGIMGMAGKFGQHHTLAHLYEGLLLLPPLLLLLLLLNLEEKVNISSS